MPQSEYGIPDIRTAEGDLKGADHEFDWNDDTVKIRVKPPTISQIREYEAMGEDADEDDLQKILERHLIKPELPFDDLTAPELMCYTQGIMDYSSGGQSELSEEVQEEIESRSGEGSGN